MSTKADLLAIADRCEREEPSRELDSRIAEVLGWTRVRSDVNYAEPAGESFWCGLDPNGHSLELPRYTTSLDAAVTLVPEGWARLVQWIGPPYDIAANARLWLPVKRTMGLLVEQVTADAKTEALALSVAALRARAAMLP